VAWPMPDVPPVTSATCTRERGGFNFSSLPPKHSTLAHTEGGSAHLALQTATPLLLLRLHLLRGFLFSFFKNEK
jgi:hypothetical protein